MVGDGRGKPRCQERDVDDIDDVIWQRMEWASEVFTCSAAYRVLSLGGTSNFSIGSSADPVIVFNAVNFLCVSAIEIFNIRLCKGSDRHN